MEKTGTEREGTTAKAGGSNAMDNVLANCDAATKAYFDALRKDHEEYCRFKDWEFSTIAEFDYRLTVAEKVAQQKTEHLRRLGESECNVASTPRKGLASRNIFVRRRRGDEGQKEHCGSGAVQITPVNQNNRDTVDGDGGNSEGADLSSD